MSFIPDIGEHTEFVCMSQTVSVVNPPDLEFRITDVSYSHPYGYTIKDMKISHTDSSFTYSTCYEMVVNRACDYSTKPSELELNFHHIDNIQDLPSLYTALYCVQNPPPSIIITFTVRGQERTITTSSDPSTGASSTTYGEWYDQTYTWEDVVYTNLDKQKELVLKGVKNSQAYKDYTNS